MKTILHKANSRGHANHGWLQANYSFSFANYYNPDKLQFGTLRVLNDDIIAPKMGFGSHPHDNMEIITIPISGELKHKDSMANEWLSVTPGEVQVMSAGSGLQHSEINGSLTSHLNLFQIWIIPNKKNVTPRYDQKHFSLEGRKDKFQTIVSSIDNDDDGLKIHQDAKISRVDISKEKTLEYKTISKNHGVYIMNVNGSISINNTNLNSRDAIAISNTNNFLITAETNSEILLIEVPML
ncbi:pirin family protein [Lacinutrix sp. 5H-3-7-4]|uniref:pirin family protein n=1 Tax=Lacinutrix sp. (strain 5H-3-7-4) TaxID=983544 RepID=UPI00020A3810|nr:pirin family protein [Lacinutrix sp. 5H-3-7-4]AEH02166.1 Pirin domain protein [Lacinutrix sp. 5H-3-7-4]